MDYYAVYSPCALVINDELAKLMLEKKGITFDPEDDPKTKLYDEFLLNDVSGFYYISDFTGEVTPLFESADWETIEDSVFYVECNHDPSLFRAVYSSEEELINEFERNLKDFLPDGFDIKSHLHVIIGTTFG